VTRGGLALANPASQNKDDWRRTCYVKCRIEKPILAIRRINPRGDERTGAGNDSLKDGPATNAAKIKGARTFKWLRVVKQADKGQWPNVVTA
jgi:hypothetical protein